jgi:hypothetical protein
VVQVHTTDASTDNVLSNSTILILRVHFGSGGAHGFCCLQLRSQSAMTIVKGSPDQPDKMHLINQDTRYQFNTYRLPYSIRSRACEFSTEPRKDCVHNTGQIPCLDIDCPAAAINTHRSKRFDNPRGKACMVHAQYCSCSCAACMRAIRGALIVNQRCIPATSRTRGKQTLGMRTVHSLAHTHCGCCCYCCLQDTIAPAHVRSNMRYPAILALFVVALLATGNQLYTCAARSALLAQRPCTYSSLRAAACHALLRACGAVLARTSTCLLSISERASR